MHAPEGASHVLHRVVEPDADRDELREVQLQGTMHFAAAEAALRELEGLPDDRSPVVLDLTRVVSASAIGRRLLTEAVERMRADGRDVRVTDPDSVLGG